jgi:hypothetical protein
MSKKMRIDDTMLTISAESAIVDFADILEACRMENDEFGDKPWDNQCGYDHEIESADHPGQKEGQGYSYGAGRRGGVIVLDEPQSAGIQETYQYHRDNGASKQVARELAAQDKARRLAQLVKWHDQGWEWYRVVCEFRGYIDSLGGIDDYDFAADDCARDCAWNVAAQLEADGYTVAGKPDLRAERLANHRLSLRFKLNQQNRGNK